MSQEALALEAELQRNYVSLLALGRYQPTLATIFKLADALKMPPSLLVAQVEVALTTGTSASAEVFRVWCCYNDRQWLAVLIKGLLRRQDRWQKFESVFDENVSLILVVMHG